MWYGSASNPTECFGPTRYMWDLGLYLKATETVVQRECAGNAPASCQSASERVPDRLAFYDYQDRSLPVHKRHGVGCIDAILGSSVALAETVGGHLD